MAPNGFTQRWKGRTAGKSFYVSPGGQGFVEAVAAASSLTTMPNSGISYIQSTTGKAVFPLAPPVPGVMKQIAVLSNSSACVIQASTAGGTAVVFDPSSNTNITFAGALVGVVTLYGISTSRWSVASFAGSTSAVPTFSTSS